ncbi:hypothetical protein B9Q17_08145 [Marinobacter vinifirmus]|uniref:Uncharacterized protein n=1 Tax=Marinobacter vinifirmus TaxID=355591 RepID=A0A7Z1DVH2_9GAMM|nr:hypothetical protein [Marinobacter vinifirmus]OZC36743.1 hypothetical protein B9Q17_08145 [Marinobacter vinifirmus]
MAREKKQKSVHYKLATISNQTESLQTLLEQALAEDSEAYIAIRRMEATNPDDDSVCRLINHHTAHQGMFFGQLVRFEKGRGQALMTFDDQAPEYSIDTITSESVASHEEVDEETNAEKVRRRREFIDSILYFGVLDNHLVVMQSQALTTRELEAHLGWLLGTCLNLIARNSTLVLQDKITESVRAKVEKSPVKTVSIGTPVEAREKHDGDSEQAQNDSKGVKWIPGGTAADILSAALGTDWCNKLKLEDSLDEANLQVQLKVTYLRKTSKAGQQMLDNIASSMRHIHDDDVVVELKDGGRLQGKDVRLNGKLSVQTTNGIVDETALYHDMHNWLISKIESDEVEHIEPDD